MEMRRGGSPLSAAGALFKLAPSPAGYQLPPGLLTTVTSPGVTSHQYPSAGQRPPHIKQEPAAGSPEPGHALSKRDDWLPSPNQTSLDSSPFGGMAQVGGGLPPGGGGSGGGPGGASFSVSPLSSSSYDPYSPTGKQGQSRHDGSWSMWRSRRSGAARQGAGLPGEGCP